MSARRKGRPSPSPSPHGTRQRYMKTRTREGCRCEPCTLANNAYMREYRPAKPKHVDRDLYEDDPFMLEMLSA